MNALFSLLLDRFRQVFTKDTPFELNVEYLENDIKTENIPEKIKIKNYKTDDEMLLNSTLNNINLFKHKSNTTHENTYEPCNNIDNHINAQLISNINMISLEDRDAGLILASKNEKSIDGIIAYSPKGIPRRHDNEEDRTPEVDLSKEYIQMNMDEIQLKELSDIITIYDSKYKNTQNLNKLDDIINSKDNMMIIKRLRDSSVSNDKKIIDRGRDIITQGSFNRILYGNWLNDEAINSYRNLLLNQSHNKHRIAIFTTYLYTKINEIINDQDSSNILLLSQLRGVIKRACKSNLLEKDIVLIPLNVDNNHWTLLIIDNKSENILYYDSIQSTKDDMLNKAKNIIRLYTEYYNEHIDQYKDKYTKSPEDWIIQHGECPSQINSDDCGVCLCMNMKYITNFVKCTYSTKLCNSIYRQMLALELYKGELQDIYE